MTSERLDEHGCLVVGNVGPHVPFKGEIRGVLIGAEAEEILRRLRNGELLNTLVFAVTAYDSNDPENRNIYVWTDDDMFEGAQ